uniref:nuclear pore membrane glycoprotein 210 n=1 Tax=Myxine glutinosa TaxID=7769 RepID=UPI00358FE42E
MWSRSSVQGLDMVLLVLVLSATRTQNAKLNVPKVLLPHSTETPINYTLEASDGCYTWRSTRPKTVSVEPIWTLDDRGQDCSQTALVTARSSHASRQTAIVFAEETVTGRLLRCDVIVDVINGIQVSSTTRELYLEDSPLKLSIRAFDREGNTFTTLAGLPFDWTIVKDAESVSSPDSHNALRLLRFSESAYQPPAHILAMERSGRHGDTVLVSGRKTGSSRLQARIVEPLYKNVQGAELHLLILENILLNPTHDVYLVVHTRIRYRVLKLRHGRLLEIAMPSDQYKLQLQGDDMDILPVVQLEDDTSTITALRKGHSKLLLQHKNMRMQGLSRLPNCSVYVTEPAFLGFSVHPGERWVLETGRDYAVTVDIYDWDSNHAFPADNIRIKATFPTESFSVLESSSNGSYHRVRALHTGATTIHAALISVIMENGLSISISPTISNSQDVEIFDPIVLHPSVLVFPWQAHPTPYHHRIKAEGGSGNFSWSSSLPEVATVTVRGWLSTGITAGMSIVRARDEQNPLHFGEMKVYLLAVSSLRFVPTRVEARLGSLLEIPISASGFVDLESRRAVPFTDCSQLHLDVTLDNAAIFQPLEGQLPTGEGHCSGVRVQSLTVGHSVLSVTYTGNGSALVDTVTLAGYTPLKASDPVYSALVTLGSSKEILFEGGPHPWVLEPSKFLSVMSTEDPDGLHGSVVITKRLRGSVERTGQQHVFGALCTALGEQVLRLVVGNHESSTNPFPAKERAETLVVCARPASLVLSPLYHPVGLGRPCPLTQQKRQLVPISNYLPASLLLLALDAHGRTFDNFSSVVLRWTTSDLSLVTVSADRPLVFQPESDASGQIRLQGIQTVFPHKKKGTVTVGVEIHGSHQRDLKLFQASAEDLQLPLLQASIELLLVEDVQVFPQNLTVFNHPDVGMNLFLHEGSGFFHINTSVGGLVDITHLEALNEVQISPLQSGVMTLFVYDLCLAFPAPTRAHVRVSDVHGFDVQTIDKVEIGKTVPVSVRVLDSAWQPFLSYFHEPMGLTLSASSSFISLEPLEKSPDEVTASFLAYGLNVGQASLSASAAGGSGHRHTSTPRAIQVFPPFRLSPRTITLIVGGTLQIMSEGGPQPQSSLTFLLANRTVAHVDGVGLLVAKSPGTTELRGMIEVMDTDSGHPVVLSEDMVIVEVVRLTGIKIHSPLSRMKTGTQMPVFVTGIGNGQTPFSLASADPPLTFHWSTIKKDTIEVQSRHVEASVEPSPTARFAMMIRAVSAGRAMLRVAVRAEQAGGGQMDGSETELVDEIHIQVFESLQLLNVPLSADKVLMSPRSHLDLHTNRDGRAIMSYRLLETSDNVSGVTLGDGGEISAGPTTGLATLHVTAREHYGLKQTAIFGIQVAPVAFIRARLGSVLHKVTNEALEFFPLGADIPLTVDFHDNVGDRFHVASVAVQTACNRDDLLQINRGATNGTFMVRAVGVGLTLLCVEDSTTSGLTDYIPVPVGHAIGPEVLDPMTQGDVICLDSLLDSPDGTRGVWNSSDDAVLWVDPKCGVAMARSPGSAVVHYTMSGTFHTHREVVVLPVQRICAFSSVELLTNVPQANPSHITIIIGDTEMNLSGKCTDPQRAVLDHHALPSTLHCHIRFADSTEPPATDVFSIKASFNPTTGHHNCEVSPLPAPVSSAQRQALSRRSTSVLIHGTPVSNPRQAIPEIVSVKVPFHPAFYLPIPQLLLSVGQPKAELEVYATNAVLDSLQVTSDWPFVEVVQLERQDLSKRPAVISVRWKDVGNLPWRGKDPEPALSVRSRLTGQHEILPIRLASSKGSVASLTVNPDEQCEGLLHHLVASYQLVFFTIFALFAGTGAVIVVYHILLAPRFQSYHPALIPPGSRGSTPQSSPSPIKDHLMNRSWPSPGSGRLLTQRSPQAHLWSTDSANGSPRY